MRELTAVEMTKVAGGLQAVVVTANVYNYPDFFFSFDTGNNRPELNLPSGGGGGGSASSGTSTNATSGLGSTFDSLINMSSIFSNEIKKVQSWGYTIVWDTTSNTDYVNRVIHVNSNMESANVLGALSHELGHVIYGHDYGLGDYSLSRDQYISSWMNNEGFAQLNTMRIREQYGPLSNVVNIQGSSIGQINMEYDAYHSSSAVYKELRLYERGADYLQYTGFRVGITMRDETAYVDHGTGEVVNYQTMYGHNWDIVRNQH